MLRNAISTDLDHILYFLVPQPYTPSGQTPFMTPYNTPRYGGVTPGQQSMMSVHSMSSPQTSSTGSTAGMGGPGQGGGVFLHPGSVTPAYRTPTQNYSSRTPGGGGTSTRLAAEDWRKAAEEWAKHKRGGGGPDPSRTPRSSAGTPRSMQ